jgi:hypothetical protein
MIKHCTLSRLFCPASAFQSFKLSAGYPTPVDHWTRSWPMPTRLTSSSVLNPEGRNAWRKGGPTEGRCIWEKHGVWAWDHAKKEGVVLRENYFVNHPLTGKKVGHAFAVWSDFLYVSLLQVDWYTDFYYPFIDKWTQRVQRHSPSKLLFFEPIPNEVQEQSPFWVSTYNFPSFVQIPGQRRTSLRTWSMLLTGTT